MIVDVLAASASTPRLKFMPDAVTEHPTLVGT